MNYNIYVKNDKTVAVKHGFNVAAFFFGAFWALYKGLWWVFFITVAVVSLLGIVINDLNDINLINLTWVLLQVAISLLYGSDAQKWEQQSLLNKGYQFVQTYKGATKKAACDMYLQEKKTNAQ